MRREMLVMLGLCGAVLLGGCTEAGPTAQDGQRNTDPRMLKVKLRALAADECHTDDPATIYPRCAKFFTELASTVGSVDEQLAGRDAGARRAAGELRSAVDSYNGLACDRAGDSPSTEQRTGCPKALRTARTGLSALAGS